MHITLDFFLMDIRMAECLVANKILNCIVLFMGMGIKLLLVRVPVFIKGLRTVSYSICPNYDSMWLG